MESLDNHIWVILTGLDNAKFLQIKDYFSHVLMIEQLKFGISKKQQFLQASLNINHKFLHANLHLMELVLLEVLKMEQLKFGILELVK